MTFRSAIQIMFATVGMLEGEIPFGEDTIETGFDPPRCFVKDMRYPGTAFTRSLGDGCGKAIGVSADPELLSRQVR